MNNEAAMNEALDSLPKLRDADPSIFTASNGVRLKLQRVSQMILADANRRIKPPTPPVVFIEEKGRNEENPNDPNFVRDIANYRFDVAMLAMRVYYVLGTTVDWLPNDVQPPESTAWSERILSVDPEADIPDAGPRRYLAWLKLYALPDEDQLSLINEIARFSGATLETDVVQAQNSFRSDTPRDPAEGVRAVPLDQRGPGDGTPAGYDSGVRGQGSGGIRSLPVGQLDQGVDLV